MNKKLFIINPNTSVEMTGEIRTTVERIKAADIDVTVTMPDFGPRSLESFYDYSLAAFGNLRLLQKNSGKVDGVLVACFGDPGLYSLKEVCQVPVVGIAEASIAMSTLMGQRFSLLVASEKAVPMMADMVRQYGFESRLASIEPIGIPVLDIEKDRKRSIAKLTEVGAKAIKKGAEVLILGCAGMTAMKTEIEDALGIPVIDPVEYGYLMLEMMVKYHLPVSKIGLYRQPAEKEMSRPELITD